MVHEVKKITATTISSLVKKRKTPHKTLADMYGKLKRGFDGLAYQKAARNEWS
ncbi:MAG: hypothetical protein LBU92_00455 [Prevotellaceae bacterium]|jgi:hypothetical protein|nr:hypothetical protein [Prevotellaceae bacterium]